MSAGFLDSFRRFTYTRTFQKLANNQSRPATLSESGVNNSPWLLPTLGAGKGGISFLSTKPTLSCTLAFLHVRGFRTALADFLRCGATADVLASWEYPSPAFRTGKMSLVGLHHDRYQGSSDRRSICQIQQRHDYTCFWGRRVGGPWRLKLEQPAQGGLSPRFDRCNLHMPRLLGSYSGLGLRDTP